MQLRKKLNNLIYIRNLLLKIIIRKSKIKIQVNSTRNYNYNRKNMKHVLIKVVFLKKVNLIFICWVEIIT